MKKSLLMIASLVSATLLSACSPAEPGSQFPCTTPLFDGYSKDNKGHFIVCESNDRLSMSLVDVKGNKLVADLLVPKARAEFTDKWGVSNFSVTLPRQSLDSVDEGLYSYTETLLGDSTYQVLQIKFEKGGQVQIEMTDPKINVLNRTLTQYGIRVTAE